MIRFIAALDNKRGIANDHGIPWQGKIPSEVQYFRERTIHSIVVMGYKTYTEFDHPLSDRRNVVATHTNEPLRPGFEAVADINNFLAMATEDMWVIGGAGLFSSILDQADELYLTLIEGDFSCTKFFPEYDKAFELAGESQPQTENGITYRFTTWRRKQ